MARSPEELEAWAELLELCDDDVQVFRTTKHMRSSVLEVEKELRRLHLVEQESIALAQMLKRIQDSYSDDEAWEAHMNTFWCSYAKHSDAIKSLIPEAFLPEAMAASLCEMATENV